MKTHQEVPEVIMTHKEEGREEKGERRKGEKERGKEGESRLEISY